MFSPWKRTLPWSLVWGKTSAWCMSPALESTVSDHVYVDELQIAKPKEMITHSTQPST